MAVQRTINSGTDHGHRKTRSGRRGNSHDNRASQVVTRRNPCFKDAINIGTWNVRSMYEPGKMNNIIQEMQRLNIDILGISDTRWSSSGSFATNNGMIYFSGNNDPHHRYGVAIVVSKKMMQSVINFTPVSDRVIFLQLHTKTVNLNIIQVYAPTAEKSDEEVEEFYKQINHVLKSIKARDVTIILGDFNSKIGEGKSGKYVGNYGLGLRNERGDRMLQFCQENDMIISNTFFKLPKRRLYTWTSPQHNAQKIVRNQIDFVLINERYKNGIKSVKAYPGADVSSDHNPLIARVSIKLKKPSQRVKPDYIDTSRLQNSKIKEELKQQINGNLRMLSKKEPNTHVENKWQNLKEALIKPAQNILSRGNTTKRQEWMTEKILSLMEERRQFKGKCKQKYN
ncbi:craniofacial development protein 2-like [Diabrotica virgifera virgifera]|uniref:Endonuclease/exonuclease/phosphatase domain-containing protein n=1 Tax=Diabrotica virgifera virgifera TaxID=50390 RepID=A0ABM5JHV0_DIAVI|nr:craniofacial development protein 2-like [Diabrotica virgifera virgifera]